MAGHPGAGRYLVRQGLELARAHGKRRLQSLDMLQTVTRDDDVSILTTRSPLRVDGAAGSIARRPASANIARRSARSSDYEQGDDVEGHDMEPSAWLRSHGRLL